MDADERAEPYARTVDEARRVLAERGPRALHAFVHERMVMLAAAAGYRHIPSEMWLGLLSMAIVAIPTDGPYVALTQPYRARTQAQAVARERFGDPEAAEQERAATRRREAA